MLLACATAAVTVGLPCFYYAPLYPRMGMALPGSQKRLRRHAEPPQIEEEPDLGKEFSSLFQESLGLNDEAPLSAEERITPIDRWFGWDKQYIEMAASDKEVDFVDSQDAMSYVTVLLSKPLGIEFIENTAEEGGGVMVGEVRPGYSAYDSGIVRPGYHLVVADDTPVYGVPFEEAIRPIVDKEGPVKLTFFAGDAVYLYGEFRPSAAWLNDFLADLKSVVVQEVSAADGQ